jgi:DNA-directed RNA polymerase I, II, and III subunit RPABC2
MSDAEEDYESDVSNESDPDEPVPKKNKGVEKPAAMRLDDADSDASSVATEDDGDVTNLLDSDVEEDSSDVEDLDEDAMFADALPAATTSSKKTKKTARANEDDASETEYNFGFSSDDDEESDLEDDNGEQYLQKLDNSVREQTIANHHPELIINNYDEVEALSVVVRDERGVVIDPLHRTLPFLSKYERTRVLGERAKQINDGAKAFVEIDPGVIDGYLIALAELEQKKIPFIIRRPLSNGASEYWKLRDLEVL